MAKDKRSYKVRNWAAYNQALINRGKITLWIDQEAKDKWWAKKRKKNGRPFIYSDEAILCLLMIKAVYRLAYRPLQGFCQSLFEILHDEQRVPCYTQICRRASRLGQQVKKLSRKQPTDLVFDSTGLKVYGEGEWKVRKHGRGKRRTWRKFHIAMCPDSHEVMLFEVTDKDESDGRVMPELLELAPSSVTRVYGDGAYDTQTCYRAILGHGAEAVIPPRRNGICRDEIYFKSRTKALKIIAALGDDSAARTLWKKLCGYHRRSLVEATFSRFKRLLGDRLWSTKPGSIRSEIYAKCLALNRMTNVGMPKGVMV
ncbi:hypothetical protein LCGC14_2700070 [marine sediment metagenome]|uniref:Transposase DDE domain-containing protein n=1 Tax=marine sediment metagenome TaxID=412755 RepID=A0A0F9BQB3_9ZZZZ